MTGGLADIFVDDGIQVDDNVGRGGINAGVVKFLTGDCLSILFKIITVNNTITLKRSSA